jgi:hypothetical protein
MNIHPAGSVLHLPVENRYDTDRFSGNPARSRLEKRIRFIRYEKYLSTKILNLLKDKGSVSIIQVLKESFRTFRSEGIKSAYIVINNLVENNQINCNDNMLTLNEG